MFLEEIRKRMEVLHELIQSDGTKDEMLRIARDNVDYVNKFFSQTKKKKINDLVDSFAKKIKEKPTPALVAATEISEFFGYNLSDEPRLIPQYIRNAIHRRGINLRKITGKQMFEVWTEKTAILRVTREK